MVLQIRAQLSRAGRDAPRARVEVDHTTLYRWVQHYAPEIEKRLRWCYKPTMGYSWRVDETYVKVKGKWAYLYRAIDKRGHTIDFYLSSTRNTQAAKRFLGKALKSIKSWAYPNTINTDKAPAYSAAITELKAKEKCLYVIRFLDCLFLSTNFHAKVLCTHSFLLLPLNGMSP